ncbi:TRAP transporter large permease subunit, partial [Xanthobacter sp. DSM 24535]
ILIPPSIPMIVYGVIAQESIGRLFMAGILPGLMLAAMFGIYQMWLARSRSGSAPRQVMGPVTVSDRLRALVDILPTGVLIAIILGSIYTGIATPTETAAIGVATSFLLAAVLYRELTWAKCRQILIETGRGSIMVLTIIAGAMLFGYALTTTDVAPTLSRLVAGADLSPWLVFIAINLLLLFLGCFLETLSIIVITTPIIIPIIESFGWDKVWFGVILMINMEMALITPPVGLNLFVVKGVMPDVSLGRIIVGTLPYVLIMALALALVALVPGLIV